METEETFQEVLDTGTKLGDLTVKQFIQLMKSIQPSVTALEIQELLPRLEVLGKSGEI